MWTPGAATSTLARAAVREHGELVPVGRGRDRHDVGQVERGRVLGLTSMSDGALPAAATTSRPAAPAALIASYSGCEIAAR